ncbi:helix-turn-helix DNA binding domain protein [Gordonia phage Clown]|uniref:Helix-turn-helix DNA binding domain protein n=1 Tax=Gordonia phage Clown TaxID=2759393 RepID=A0A7L7STG7_9CAUD|nr:Rnase E [Gordonia phage Clown]QOC55999.1 helix-turn-helix DNA binding domain protein [Gordonia phage Clown]
MGDAKTSLRHQTHIQEREHWCLEAFLQGKKYVDIAKEVGFRDPTSARKAVERAIARRRKERDELADEAATIVLEQLGMLLATDMPAALNPQHPDHFKAVDSVLRVLDRRVKLEGLDKPIQVEATVRVKDELDDEIAALARKLKSQAPADALPATPVLDSIIDAQIVDDAEVEA